jgi:capsular exopolysaccharide synthesis family protein
MKMFADNLVVEHPVRTQTIHIAYTDRDPGVAANAVKAIIKAYEQMYAANDSNVKNAHLQAMRKLQGDLRRAMELEKQYIRDIAKGYGTDNLDGFFQNKLQQFNSLDAQLTAAKLQLTLREAKGDPGGFIDSLTTNQIGMMDQMMATKLQILQAAQSELMRLSANTGDRNPRVLEAKKVEQSARQDVEDYATQYRDLKKKLSQSGMGNGGFGDVGATKESLEAEVKSLTKLYESQKSDMIEIGNKQMEIKTHLSKIDDMTKQMSDLDREAELLIADSTGPGRLQVISYGEVPVVPFKDRRKQMAAAGFAGGFALPIALCMALGFVNKRLRYSDEAEGGDGMPPLLGILPTLPDRLSDPEQAAVAAHCVHQLRIMLQVNGGSDRKVYMITSASAGDGKTSLTMALGLSFAASGSRTLVIDSDMVGQGLTTRLKAKQSEGLLEALGAGTLQGRVKKTTTPNLYILPIGGADSAHAGSMSPVSIRKLLAEARRIFDFVIIDTGPILGSLEAAVVGAAADAVILTIARGQSQPLVDRSVRQLRQIGANVAGLVFNRAEKRDFQRSVGSSSIKSISTISQPQRTLIAENAEESRFGPLARSVASFMPGAFNGAATKELPPGKAEAAGGKPGGDEIRVQVVAKAEGELDEHEEEDAGIRANGSKKKGGRR